MKPIFILYLALPLAKPFLQRGSPQKISQSASHHVSIYRHSSLFDPRIEGRLNEETQFSIREDSDNGNTKLPNRHYSASDWLYNLKTIRNSTVLREVLHPVVSLGLWATFVSLVQKIFLLTGKASWATNISIPHAAHSFMVSSLGLLLVFRTNSAYQRFLEGRKIWEHILSISRNLSRFTSLYKDEIGTRRKSRIINLLAAFPYLLRHQVRSGCLCQDYPNDVTEEYRLCLREPSRPEMKCWVDRRDIPWSLIENAQHQKKEDALEKIAKVTNRPLWICDRLGREVMDIPMNQYFTSRERLKMLAEVDKLANAVGSCERIHQTAVPLHYARHALRGLTVWMVTLPFSLVKDFGLLTGPVTAIVAWLLFGVYQIGHSIEDPFQGSLKLSTLCDHIRRDVLASDDSRQSAFSLEGEDSHKSEVDFLPPNPVGLSMLAPPQGLTIVQGQMSALSV